jgi:DnaJ-class molecular chaperone
MAKKCPECNGTGVKVTRRTCETCGGRKIRDIYVPGYGPAIQLCPECKGLELFDEETCPECQGLGWLH